MTSVHITQHINIYLSFSAGMYFILIVDLMRAQSSDLLNVAVLRWRSHVLRLGVEYRGVGGGPCADRVVGGEGRLRPLRGVVVGRQHRGGGLCGDSPANIKIRH